MNSDSIGALRDIVRKFRDARNWRKYHKPKDLAIAIMVESAELLELFQWLREDEIDVLVKKPKFIQRISEEMADIFIYLLSLADILGIDLGKSVIEKMKKNEQKYPVERSPNDKVKNKIVEQYL